MSYNRIFKPEKRDDEVKKYLALKNYLRGKDRAEKMGEVGRAEELSRIFKPVTSSTEKLKKELSEKIEKIPQGIAQVMPAFSALPALPAPYTGYIPPPLEEGKDEATGGEDEEEFLIPGDPELSEILRNFQDFKYKTEISPLLDVEVKKNGEFKFLKNKKELTITKHKIKYNNRTYTRTPELLDLIFSIDPKNESLKNLQAKGNYKQIIKDSGVLESRNRLGRNTHKKKKKKKKNFRKT